MGKLYEEFKRRKVFRVAAVYAIVAWLIIQVTGEVLPTFEAPQWVNQTIILVLILGFPLSLVLAWAFELTPEGVKVDSGVQPIQAPTVNTDRKLIYATFVLVLLTVGFQVVDRFLIEHGEEESPVVLREMNSNQGSSPVTRVQLALPAAQEFLSDVTLNPDGSEIIYRGLANGETPGQLWRRSLDVLEATPIPNTVGAEDPQFSRDGESISFILENSLGVIATDGGTPDWLDNLPDDLSYAWGDDGAIYWISALELSGNRTLMRWVPGSVDALEVPGFATTLESIGAPLNLTDVLPGSDAVIFWSNPYNIYILNLSSGELLDIGDGAFPRFLQTGHLVFVRPADGEIFIQPFDPLLLEAMGPPTSTSAQMSISPGSDGYFDYSVATDGSMIYASGLGIGERLVWVDRSGAVEPIDGLNIDDVLFDGISLSPSGEEVVASIRALGEPLMRGDLWILNLREKTRLPLTRDGASVRPDWHPTEQKIAYVSHADNNKSIRALSVDGSGQGETLLDLPPYGAPEQVLWNPDGREVILRMGGESGRSIFRFLPGEDEDPQPVLDREFDELDPILSPNGDWLAYVSDQSGRRQVYVQSYPNGGRTIPVSLEEGLNPMWSLDGSEIYYWTNDALWSANVSSDTSGLRVTSRAMLFPAGEEFGNYDVAPDGRFLISERITRSSGLVLVRNWLQEVTQEFREVP